MKFLTLLVVLLFVTSIPMVFAADDFLFSSISKSDFEILFEFDDKVKEEGEKYKETKIYKNLASLKSTTQLSPVFKINTSIFDSKQVSIPTFRGVITFETTSLEKENKSEFVWKGSDRETSAYATIIVRGDNVSGNIHVQDGLYSIKALGSGYHVLKEVNVKAFVDEPPNYEKIIGEHRTDWVQVYKKIFTQIPPKIFVDKTIHLMVLYTENVDDLIVDIDAEIALALEETNDSHIMSDSDSRYKIVHTQEIEYEPVGVPEDVDKMEDPLDVDLDFIHNLRDEHGADVVLLITDDPAWCGWAGSIGGDESEGFAVVDYDCMTGYYSFGHEIGHIHGARHIISTDSSSTPFEYGHGYCDQNTPLNWRTIMAYNCPSGTGGDRQQYWSNPNITVNGDASGTTGLQDNARVHDGTFEYVCSFREPICRDQFKFLKEVEILYKDNPFCFDSYPISGGLPQKCIDKFDPCGCGNQAPLCDSMQCSSFLELYELVTFTQLQEIRPYHLIKMGVDPSMILPRDGMVLLDSDKRDKPIRVTVESAKKLMSWDNSLFLIK
ncbi:MAG: zinc-dependent metalloprotease [Nitrosopumilus sp.]|nr:zinc-dependent metalloprotease [Nitrosopumilus sp.]MDH3855421.1 zinc-dependent metalloprotease [Nitrosopumilus sp.]